MPDAFRFHVTITRPGDDGAPVTETSEHTYTPPPDAPSVLSPGAALAAQLGATLPAGCTIVVRPVEP